MGKLKDFTFIIMIIIIGCQSAEKKTHSDTLIQSVEPTKTEKVPSMKTMNIDIDYCMGRFDPTKHTEFVAIPLKYADREGMYMRVDAYAAFEKMYSEAYEDGVKFIIKSAARNFDYQKGIWERKWTGETKLSDGTDVAKDIQNPVAKALKILEYSSMPGTSRHHWGTDIDLNAFNNEFFEEGEGKKIYEWLVENGSDYGFCQPYTRKAKNRPYGYNEEKWHWSYLPVSQDITLFAEENLKNDMIQGFLGAETAIEIDVVQKYVLGIHHGCRH